MSQFFPRTFHFHPRPRTFNSLLGDLNGLLDKVKAGAAKGKKEAAVAYGEASSGKRDYGKGPDGRVLLGPDGQPSKVTVTEKGVKDFIKPFVDSLTPEEVQWFAGLNFTDANDDAKKRTDIVNTIVAAWDKAAGKYMNQDIGGGDALRDGLVQRLQQLDATLSSRGQTPVAPDQ